MAIVSNLDLIRRVPLFSDLTAGQSSILYASVDKKRFKRGENIVEQGKISGTLYMILSGKARVLSQDARGREVIMATLDVGDCIGEMSLIDGSPRSATCVATTDVVAGQLTRDALAQLMNKQPGVAARLLLAISKRLSDHLREANRKILALTQVSRALQLELDAAHAVNRRLLESRMHRAD